MKSISPRWKPFLKHLSSYVIVIGGLALLNWLTSPGAWWVVWPAVGWGIGLAFDLRRTLLGEEETDTADSPAAAHRPDVQDADLAPTAVPAQSRLRGDVAKARLYRRQIQELLADAPAAGGESRRQALARQVDEWVQSIEALARRVEEIQQNPLIQQDTADVPRSIEALKTRLSEETNPDLRRELERTLTSRQTQLDALTQLQQTVAQAEMKIESALSALGTIYSQLLTGQSTADIADYRRLSEEVDEEVRVLRDHLEALREVRLDNSAGRSAEL